MNDREIKEIGKVAYKKANRMLNGEVPLNIGDFTVDELKIFLLTLDGLGRDFKCKVMDELIERAKEEVREYYNPY